MQNCKLKIEKLLDRNDLIEKVEKISQHSCRSGPFTDSVKRKLHKCKCKCKCAMAMAMRKFVRKNVMKLS